MLVNDFYIVVTDSGSGNDDHVTPYANHISAVDMSDGGFISNTLALQDTTRFGATRLAGSWNFAVKRVGVGVVSR